MATLSPMKTRGMLGIGDGIVEGFAWPALLPLCHHCPPPLEGGSDLSNITASWLRLTDSGDDSVHGGPLTS